MLKQIDACVDCGKSPCYHCKETVYICDQCKCETDALYKIDSEELCEMCVEIWANQVYEDMSIKEKLDAVGFDYEVLK